MYYVIFPAFNFILLQGLLNNKNSFVYFFKIKTYPSKFIFSFFKSLIFLKNNKKKDIRKDKLKIADIFL